MQPVVAEEAFKPVTSVDAYNALLAAYSAECGDCEDEDEVRVHVCACMSSRKCVRTDVYVCACAWCLSVCVCPCVYMNVR